MFRCNIPFDEESLHIQQNIFEDVRRDAVGLKLEVLDDLSNELTAYNSSSPAFSVLVCSPGSHRARKWLPCTSVERALHKSYSRGFRGPGS